MVFPPSNFPTCIRPFYGSTKSQSKESIVSNDVHLNRIYHDRAAPINWSHINEYECNDNLQKHLPGSIPSVFGASNMGAKIVTFLMVTFLQSYG